MAILQQQARALGDPTRHALYRHIADAGRALGVAELNEHFPCNHNAIRQHLAKLVAAGLVVEEQAPANGPGRPRLMYMVNPVAEGQWGTTGPYERLSRLLIEVIRSGLSAVEVGRRAAADLRVASPSGSAPADISAAMARQGFMPEVLAGRGGGAAGAGKVEIVLRRCPFQTAAQADRQTVCSLHLGIAEGLAEGTDVDVDELVANDPVRADCRLRLRAMTSEPTAVAPVARLTFRGGGTPVSGRSDAAAPGRPETDVGSA